MGNFLDDLCRVYSIETLPNGSKIRVRALSDMEQRERDLEAVRASALLVEKLRDETSRDYSAIMLPILQGGPETIRATLVSFRYMSATREANRDIQPVFIPFPDKASEEEKRDVETKRQAQTVEIGERRTAEVTRLVEETTKQLKDVKDEDLTPMFKKQAANANADSLWSDEFIRQTIYMSCENEAGTVRYFESFDDVRSLHPKVRDFLWRKYAEVDAVDPFLLGSQLATESSTA